ncbi:MAG: right-handed parallel beta-helix repeat-containing protein, partial [Pseudomonadota bacterium]
MTIEPKTWLYSALLSLSLIVQLPTVSHALTLDKDTVWQGEIKVSEDILVPKGITLTIRPGASVKVAVAESTKTDPEYMSPLTEITIRGTLRVEGTTKEPVVFSGEANKTGNWAGIVIDRGVAVMNSFSIKNAETAINSLDGNLKMNGAVIQDNRYGLVLQGSKSDTQQENSLITGNDYGVFTLQGAHLVTKSSRLSGNRKRDSFTAKAKELPPLPVIKVSES